MAEKKVKSDKPAPEVKALSLYLMAFKKTDPACNESSKRMNKMWRQVTVGDRDKKHYLKEVENMLQSYGGYTEVLEKTVRFYIETTGEWKLEGEDKYCKDAQRFAEKIMNQK